MTPLPSTADHIVDELGRPWYRTMEAGLWAKAFVAINPETKLAQLPGDPPEGNTEGALIGWFANAIMAGYDYARHSMEDPVVDGGPPPGLMELARGVAARCWCDPSTCDKEMDADLAQSFALRVAPLMHKLMILEELDGSQFQKVDPDRYEFWNHHKINEHTSDGYHTFGELYEHRHALFLFLLMQASEDLEPWFTLLHEDGTMFDGYFLAGCDVRIEDDQWVPISYHLPIRYLDTVERLGHVEKRRNAPPFDGYTAEDVADRLLKAVMFHVNQWGIR